MKIHFITFGCKVNLYETENMKQTFMANGFEVSDNSTKNPADCDIYVLNSCTVTETGDKKLRKEIRKLRRENPDAIIALTGCFPQAFKDEAEKIPDIDIIMGTKNRAELLELINTYIEDRKKSVKVCDFTRHETFEYMQNTDYTNNTRAFVKIQDGCNMFCSYCIIPYSRGNFRSKKLDDIKCEVETLATSGYKEIVLVGINLSFYGIEYGLRLVDAINLVCNIDGIERVRLGSLEPEMISDEDIKTMAIQKKLCPQFHLSLQSGCDKTLKTMNRRYNTDDYMELVTKLRDNFENCSITTDIMVGFPDETDEDFNASMEFVKKAGFSQAHIFPYSRRKGTPAAEMDNQVPENIKNIRVKKMSEVTDISAEKFLQSQVGLTIPVLFEREKNDKIPYGYSPNYTLIKSLTKNPHKSLRNSIFYVKIERLEKDYCVGEILDNS